MHVLLVEDDVSVGEMLEQELSHEGLTVDWRRSALTACEAFIRGSYDALLIDLGLPDIDGLHLVRKVRQLDQAVPVLIVSGRSDVGERIKALDCGADDYLVKPFEMPELLARLRAIQRRLASSPGDLH